MFCLLQLNHKKLLISGSFDYVMVISIKLLLYVDLISLIVHIRK